MESIENPGNQNKNSVRSIIDICIRITALALLLIWCFHILEPFITILVWASVMAIALYPVFKSFKKFLRGKNALTASLLVILMLAILIAPAVWMMISAGMQLKDVGEQVKAGNISIPPPTENVRSIPVLGKTLFDMWSLASTNLQQLVVEYKEQVRSVGETLVGMVTSTGKGLLLLAIAIIISGVLLAYAKTAGNAARAFFVRLAGENGAEMASVAEVTVRNVTRGILGVAFIQSLIAGVIMFLAAIPFAGLWTLLCFILAIVQIGILPVSIGVIIYIWTSASTSTAIIITIAMVLVGILDNILKPIMLGKGAPVPMLIVFLGAIGGFIYSGFIGLFTGAIILSLGYKLYMTWLNQNGTTPIPQ